MSSFEEIKGLFINEIKNTFQYTVGLKIKDLIIQDIITPNVNLVFSYQLLDIDYVDINNKEKEENIIRLALKLILDLDVDITNNIVSVNMFKFLS